MTLLCCAPEQVFPALGHLQLSQGICENIKEQGEKKKGSTHTMLQKSAINKKYLKPCCFAMTMTNEILLMWY